MSNRYKNTNAVPVAALTRWVIVALFLGATGLSYVYLKNQLHTAGDEIRNLERQLSDLQTQNDVASGKISLLAARGSLQKRRADGFIHMIPITNDRLVMINAVPARDTVVGELRRVSNEEIVK